MRVVALAVLVLGGCASRTTVPERAPDDFRLNLAVWREKPLVTDDDRIGSEDPDAVQPGRYVLLAGGALHWSPDGDPKRGLPPRRRVLSMTDVAELWTLLREEGLADPQRGTPPESLRLIEPFSQELTAVAVITGLDRSWMFRDSAAEPTMSRLARRMEELAWARPLQAADPLPRRFDFGPDPYERYRR
jgi:hypothetical protein